MTMTFVERDTNDGEEPTITRINIMVSKCLDLHHKSLN
jgi:hypothetical protein